MDKLTAIKIKYDDGTYSDEIPVSVLAENVEWDSTHTLVDVLGNIDTDVTGTIQDQINQLFNEKVSNTQLQDYVASQLTTDVTKWLNTNVNPVGSAVVVDKSLSVEGAAADAKKTGEIVENYNYDISKILKPTNNMVNLMHHSGYFWEGHQNSTTLYYVIFPISAGEKYICNSVHPRFVAFTSLDMKTQYSESKNATDGTIYDFTSAHDGLCIVSLFVNVTDCKIYKDGLNIEDVEAYNDVTLSDAVDAKVDAKVDAVDAKVDAVVSAKNTKLNSIPDTSDNEKILYATSTFSGWVTNYPAPKRPLRFDKLRIKVKTQNNVATKARVYIGTGQVKSTEDPAIPLYDNVFDINIAEDTEEDIEIELGCDIAIPKKPFYIGMALNGLSGFEFKGSNESFYITSGNINADLNSNLWSAVSGGGGRMLNFRIYVNDYWITLIDHTDFTELIPYNGYVDGLTESYPQYKATLCRDYSTFSGFSGFMGNAQNFDSIVVKVHNRDTEKSLTKVAVAIAYDNKDGEVILNKQYDVTPILPDTTDDIVIRLGEVIENPDGRVLYIWVSWNVIGGAYIYTVPSNVFEKSSIGWQAGGAIYEDARKLFTYNLSAEVIQIKYGKYAFSIGFTDWQKAYIKEAIDSATTPVIPPRIIVPNQWRAVAGDTLQLFYRGFIEGPDPYHYNIEFICNIGKNTRRYFEVTPTEGDVGDHTVTINVRSLDDTILATATSKIVVSAGISSPSSQKNILCIGDSLTAGGAWVEEARRRLIGTGGAPTGLNLTNLNWIGTVHRNQTDYEGYGGWTWRSYLNKPSATALDMWVYCTHDKTNEDQHSIWKDVNDAQWSMETIESNRIKFTRVNGQTSPMPTGSGTLAHVDQASHTSNISYTETAYGSGNPFWDATGDKVDFQKYCERNGFSGIDYVYTLLTWNGLGGYCADPDKGNVAAQASDARTLLRILKANYPNIKVGLMGIQVNSINGGTGRSYGANSVYSNWYGDLRTVMGMNLAYKALAEEDEFKDWVEFIHISSQFDSENNMPQELKPVNTRSELTEYIGTNGVHPSNMGYYQIADAAFRHMASTIK